MVQKKNLAVVDKQISKLWTKKTQLGALVQCSQHKNPPYTPCWGQSPPLLWDEPPPPPLQTLIVDPPPSDNPTVLPNVQRGLPQLCGLMQ